MGWRGMTLRPQPLMSLQAGACRLQNQGPKVRARRAEPAVEILAQAIVARADRRAPKPDVQLAMRVALSGKKGGGDHVITYFCISSNGGVGKH